MNPSQSLLVQNIGAVLNSQLPARWSLVPTTNAPSIKRSLNLLAAIWRVEFIEGDITYPNVTHLFVAIDNQYPRTQPIIWLPQYVHGKSKRWPHIDIYGNLCLPKSSMADDPAQRVIQHLAWAQSLLNMDPINRRKDFAREAAAYWDQAHDNKEKIYSLLSLNAESRLIVYSVDNHQTFFAADTPEELTQYLKNLRSTEKSAQIYPGYLLWLDSPWLPDEFPVFGSDLLNLIPKNILDQILVAGRDCLIVIGAKTDNGIIFLASLLRSQKLSEAMRGFRTTSKLPTMLVHKAFTTKKILKANVSRIDGAWVHGRDHDPNYETLHHKKVVICGCGSLGASVARLLAQAGVGTIHLIDNDTVASHNASRHILGVGSSGASKVTSLRKLLLADFPHMLEVTAHHKKFETLTQQELELIQGADVIVSAGIDISGDLFLDEWRRTHSNESVHVCAWAEAFAVAGHAVALFNDDSVSAMFDENMEIIFRSCDVPESANHLVAMAGCGDVFQPHGAIELQSTVNIAARIVIDILMNKVANSTRRTWFGNRDEALQRNLIPRADFNDDSCIKDFPWH
ncbi:ThiF family adenylyltransferase [Cellvibrio sp.]|uniref:ThiF family adenylyltransferase n=1 Tax=Cellvibrio sp. TaxID=1965322 RepID=UPI0039647B77